MGKEQNSEREAAFFNRLLNECSDYTEIVSEDGVELFFRIGSLDTITGMKVLEAGSGIGAIGRKIARNGNVVVGIDISPQMVQTANSFGEKNYHAIVANIEDQKAFEDATFDLICCHNVLHHLPAIDKAMYGFFKWLKPKGKIIIFEPNGSNPVSKLCSLLANRLARLNERYFHRNFICTSNVVFHTIRSYSAQINNYGLDILHCRSYLSGSLNSNPVSCVIYLLHRFVGAFLPKNLKGNGLLIIAQKRSP